MTVRASSEACRLASARARSILARSVLMSSWAFLSASDTAFCSSDMACRFTSFTASSAEDNGCTVTWARRPGLQGPLPTNLDQGLAHNQRVCPGNGVQGKSPKLVLSKVFSKSSVPWHSPRGQGLAQSQVLVRQAWSGPRSLHS